MSRVPPEQLFSSLGQGRSGVEKAKYQDLRPILRGVQLGHGVLDRPGGLFSSCRSFAAYNSSFHIEQCALASSRALSRPLLRRAKFAGSMASHLIPSLTESLMFRATTPLVS